MRNNNCNVNVIRSRVFEEVARLGYEGLDHDKINNLPYKIIPYDEENMRETIFLERAIVGERIRLAMGMSLRDLAGHNVLSEGVEESFAPGKYYEQPLVNIINFACNGCEELHYEVTNKCQGCLARHCKNTCPRKAITFVNGKAFINQDLCVKCGACANACSYNAIIRFERPCAKACGMKAIGSDKNGKAKIDYDKCVSCGQCIVNCPFGAIGDKSQLFQLTRSIAKGEKVIACLAPAFWGQFGDGLSSGQVKAALYELGFHLVVEVAAGADICAVVEAREYLDTVPGEREFLATSCCPAWSLLVKKEFPDMRDNISHTLTPMVLTARICKKEYPGCKVVFVGPCTAKKREASRKAIRSDVDYVVTFEELQGMLDAKGIDISTLKEVEEESYVSKKGISFATSKGVAGAVAEVIDIINFDPDREVMAESIHGLDECRKMLMKAKAGKYPGYLLEGMACPGGCVAGAGTIQPPEKTARNLDEYKASTPLDNPLDSEYLSKARAVMEEKGKDMPEE